MQLIREQSALFFLAIIPKKLKFVLLGVLFASKILFAQTVAPTGPADPSGAVDPLFLTALAEKGNAIAQFNLGIHYDQGRGVPQPQRSSPGTQPVAASPCRTNGARLYATAVCELRLKNRIDSQG